MLNYPLFAGTLRKYKFCSKGRKTYMGMVSPQFECRGYERTEHSHHVIGGKIGAFRVDLRVFSHLSQVGGWDT